MDGKYINIIKKNKKENTYYINIKIKIMNKYRRRTPSPFSFSLTHSSLSLPSFFFI